MDNQFDDVDLDIKNYEFDNLINLYKTNKKLDDEDMHKIKKINKTISKANIHEEIKSIFSKSYILLDCVKHYRNYKSIADTKHIYSEKDDFFIIEILKQGSKLIDAENDLKNSRFDPLSFIKSIAKEIDLKNNNNSSELQNNNATIQSINNPTTITTNYPFNPPLENPITNTFENRVSQSKLNPIKRDTQLTNIHINSCFRDRYYDTNPCNYKYNLPNGQYSNVLSMKLASVEIPNAWFLFSHLKHNNKFIVEITTCGKCAVFHIVVPDGNYDRDTLVAYLNGKYFHESEEETTIKNLKISIDHYTNRTKFEIVEDAPDDLVFSLHFTDEDTENMLETLGWTLGFRLARYIKIQDTIQSEGLFDGGGDRYVYLSVDDYQNNHNATNVVCFDKMSITDNILAKIPLVNGKFSLIVDENDSNPLVKIRQYTGPVTLRKFDIKLLDKFGNIIDLNFMDWSFSLEFETLYENYIKQ